MKLYKKILIIVAIYLLSLALIFAANWMRMERHRNEAFNSIEVNEISMFREPIESIIKIPEVVLSDSETDGNSIEEENIPLVKTISDSDTNEERYGGNEAVEQSVATETLNSSVSFISMGVPNIDSSFKTWMPWQVWLKAQNSTQFKFFKNYGWVDSQGFVRCSAEKDLGIPEDYYMVALGSYYGTTLGTKYKITLDTGRVFYAILGEFKANIHTNSTNQYSINNNDIVEFVVDDNTLNPTVKSAGSANVYMPLNGRVVKIERIDFEQLK